MIFISRKWDLLPLRGIFKQIQPPDAFLVARPHIYMKQS